MTNEQQHYDRKKLIILRAALIAIGAALGGTALWQYFAYYPDVVKREFRIVITVVSSAVLALILGLSAKPFYRLGASVADSVRALLSELGAKGVAAVVLGLIAAGAAAYLTDVIIRDFLDIWAVRLLADVLVYLLFAALGCYGFTRWLVAEEDEAVPPPPDAGYLLAADCFGDDRVLTAADALINVKVREGAYKATCLFGDSDAVKRLDSVVRSGSAKVLRFGKDFADRAEFVALEKRLAQSKRLKYVSTESDADVKLDAFALPVVSAAGDDKAQTAGEGGADDELGGE